MCCRDEKRLLQKEAFMLKDCAPLIHGPIKSMPSQLKGFASSRKNTSAVMRKLGGAATDLWLSIPTIYHSAF
jgi:hypothetical protein